MSFHSLTPTWDDPHELIQRGASLLPEPLPDMDVPYEYAQGFLARVVMWAANRKSSELLHISAPEKYERDGEVPSVKAWASGANIENLTRHNLAAGDYRLVVRDAASGIETAQTLTVK